MQVYEVHSVSNGCTDINGTRPKTRCETISLIIAKWWTTTRRSPSSSFRHRRRACVKSSTPSWTQCWVIARPTARAPARRASGGEA